VNDPSVTNDNIDIQRCQAYRPQKEQVVILDRAMAHIKSIPYPPSTRWLFYRLLQDGTYRTKKDYRRRFLPVTSRARKRFYGEWRPWTLVDDTRDIITRWQCYPDAASWFEALATIPCELDPWPYQDYYILVVFEARAMVAQFEYYCPKFVPLVPFGGDPGPAFKWQIAELINEARERYGKQVKLLYFGDCDRKGHSIYRTAIRDLRLWCNFESEWLGLTREQAERLGLPENFESPGQYQWEALTDEQARSIILPALDAFLKPYPEELKNLEKQASDLLCRKMEEAENEF